MRDGLFYVYEHWRPDKDVCFYVGKGRRWRANTLRHGRNKYHMNVPKRPHTAATKEKMRIAALARKDLDSHMQLMCSRSHGKKKKELSK